MSLVSALYSGAMRAVAGLLPIGGLFNNRLQEWQQGRQRWQADLQKLPPEKPRVWFHAASLGEFEQGRPVMEAFRQQYPDYAIVLTFFSPSGYRVRQHYDGADAVCYLPLDTPRNVEVFLDTVNPNMALFIKYEFWPNYLTELHRRQIPILFFSTAFRPNQLFFKPYGGFYRNLLGKVNWFLVQNQQSVELLQRIGYRHVQLAGDTRFDRVAATAASVQKIPVVEEFKNKLPLLVVGSAWPADMAVLIPFLNEFPLPLKVIIAPHEIHPAQISQWQQAIRRPSVRYSELAAGSTLRPDAFEVLFIDNIGMLSALYQYGTFAYIGGAFREGLHNILEAAAFGMPIFLGPAYSNYPEAVDLVAEGAAFPIQNPNELNAVFQQQYANPNRAARISRAYVQRNVGATATVMQAINRMIE